MVDPDVYMAVVVITHKSEAQFEANFTTIGKAVDFVAEQVTEEQEKVYAVKDALSQGYDLGDFNYRIFATEDYNDAYTEDEED